MTVVRHLFSGRALLLVFLGIWATAVGTFAIADSNPNPEPGYLTIETGAIISAAASADSGACAATSCWTPSAGDVARLEGDLGAFFSSSKAYGADMIRGNIDQYKRKYFGITREGKKFILVSGLCKKYWRPASKKFLSPQRPMTDMGSCFFSLEYNIATRRFSDLYIDGEG